MVEEAVGGLEMVEKPPPLHPAPGRSPIYPKVRKVAHSPVERGETGQVPLTIKEALTLAATDR